MHRALAVLRFPKKVIFDPPYYTPHKIIRNVKLLNYKEHDDVDVSIGGKMPMKRFKWTLF